MAPTTETRRRACFLSLFLALLHLDDVVLKALSLYFCSSVVCHAAEQGMVLIKMSDLRLLA